MIGMLKFLSSPPGCASKLSSGELKDALLKLQWLVVENGIQGEAAHLQVKKSQWDDCGSVIVFFLPESCMVNEASMWWLQLSIWLFCHNQWAHLANEEGVGGKAFVLGSTELNKLKSTTWTTLLAQELQPVLSTNICFSAIHTL